MLAKRSNGASNIGRRWTGVQQAWMRRAEIGSRGVVQSNSSSVAINAVLRCFWVRACHSTRASRAGQILAFVVVMMDEWG